MKRGVQYLTVLLGALMILALAPAFADRTPDWMVGRFDSDARTNGTTFTLNVSSQGSMSATLEGDRRIRVSASFRGDTFTLDDRDYTVVKTGDGFRAVPIRDGRHQGNSRNRDDNDRFAAIFFHRIDDRRDNGPGRDDGSLPNWMTGRFDGSSRKDSRTISLRINDRGGVSATRAGSGRIPDRLSASYRRNVLSLGGSDYTVERTSEGFRAVPIGNRNNRRGDRDSEINFRRTGR